jgi:cobalamin biosynthetic protein CobC
LTKMIEPIAHGGALARAMQEHGGSAADWLDLSTGISPHAPTLPPFPSELWTRLPDADLFAECVDAARRAYGFPDTASMACAPGVQALIQLLPLLRPDARPAVLSPTYGEYAHVFQTFGSGCASVHSVEQLMDADIGVIVNPNNPDGRITPPGRVLRLAEAMAAKGGLLVVDEAFCDLTPDVSVASHAGMKGLLVLKSFGKFFGLAGVRLGFAAGHGDDIDLLSARLGPWAVSGPALAVGAHCLGDIGLRRRLSAAIRSSSQAQGNVLSQAGLRVAADAGLFQLVDCDDAAALHHALAQRHILTRVFGFNPRWLRLGLCDGEAQRARLASALKACLTPAA